MADALISVVLERLASVARQQIRALTLVLGIETDIKSLTNTLHTVRDVLEDAERRQVEDKAVLGWLERLKDMAYQMNDVVDDWSNAILQLQIEGAEIASMSKKKVSSWIPTLLCLCFKQVASHCVIALKIKRIKPQLDAISSQRIQFNFAFSRSELRRQRLVTTSAIDISGLYDGRDMDEKAILDYLLGNECQKRSGLYIVSIVGTGGMGKTTLAKLAYNNRDVKHHFDERIWVCVSDPFDPIRICRAIVEAIKKEPCHLHDLEALQQKVQKCIAGKKFLLVLDDVWTEKPQLWEQLEGTFTCGAVGSRILVTTRKESVVEMMTTTYNHPLGELSRKQSRALFLQIAFGRNTEKMEELKEIGEKIADKCKGLPLAIKTLGNLMRSKNSKEEWENALNSEVWRLDVFGRDISPALLLSYHDLPPAIKRCFSFCAVFPKDSVIEVDELIKLWMAQGYLNLDLDRSKEMETVGREYFEHLAARSFFQHFVKGDDDRIIACKMHDIVHDFSQLLTKNECFIMEVDNQKEGRIDLSLIQEFRHATLIVRESPPEDFVSTYEMKNLHTLLVKETFNSRAPPNWLGHLTRLRALSMALGSSHNELLKELPKEVGKLIGLRYLNLSWCTQLRCLPETICGLYNLQTLNICGCLNLRKLPQAMGKLINLRHLQNAGTFVGLPKDISRLNSLQTLELFFVSSDGDNECKIEDLRNLNNLRESLEISGLWKVKDAREAQKAELKNMIHLQHLRLRFGVKEDVAEALQPHPNLKSLIIEGYGNREWPNWMMGSSLTQLRNLELWWCTKCPCLPPLGQLPVLEMLEISRMYGVKCISDEFLGSSSTTLFPKLKVLKFINMIEWKQWEVKEEQGRSIMPRLNYLVISSCLKLEGLPDHVLQRTSLQQLDILGSPILKHRYRKAIGVDWHKISQIPKVKYINGHHTSPHAPLVTEKQVQIERRRFPMPMHREVVYESTSNW